MICFESSINKLKFRTEETILANLMLISYASLIT